MLCAFLLAAATTVARAETRVLKFYNLHTNERAEIAYKRNGRYLQDGLDRINYILRDWRKNEEIKINPRLLDLVWHVYQITGSKDYINVICGYRTPATNAMLRRRSSGVAKKSQHTMGNALDFFLPDVPLAKLRKIALKLQDGGVGYYPHSGSPFVHLDVANVRHWPRMNRKQLLALFPNGKTLHVPADGKPLAGYQQALAEYKDRKRNDEILNGQIRVANNSRKRSGGLLAGLFGGGADEEEDAAEAAASPRMAQAPRTGRAVSQAERRPSRPAKQPETPATVLASLTADAVPVPRAAPRSEADVGQALPEEAPVPTEPVTVASATPASPAAEGPSKDSEKAITVAALDVPVPTTRPEPASAPETGRAAASGGRQPADRAEDAPVPALAAIAADVPEPAGSDAIAEILAKEEGARMSASRQTAMLPLPQTRPELQKASLDADAVPRPIRASLTRGGDARERGNATDFGIPMKKARRVSDTPRLALLKDESRRPPAAVIGGGVKTTPKGAKPKPGDSPPEPRAVVVPAKASRTPERVFTTASLRSSATDTIPPAFDIRLVRAPTVVYTKGFSTDGAQSAQDQHFSGQAVTFLAVARFATN